MTIALVRQLTDALAEFSSRSRLYELTIGEGNSGPAAGTLLVEAFAASDAVQEVGYRDVIVLSTSSRLDAAALLGQPALLAISLADGSRSRFGGEISDVAMLGSDGGLARYRLRLSPWIWRLGQVRNSRVWQDRSVIEIVDAVFQAYQPLARWRWSDDARPFMAQAMSRSYCCQYRETDLAFVQRLLVEEGLGWRCEHDADGPAVVLFADTTQPSAVPEDSSSESSPVRYHGARSVEASDTVQSLMARRRLHASLTTVLSYDYKAKQAVAANSPSRIQQGSELPILESYDVPGQYAYATRAQARRHADLRMEAQEARYALWRGRSTLRTLSAGTRLTIGDVPLARQRDAAFTVLRVVSVGVNNMPPSAQHALAELFGPIPELLEEIAQVDVPEDFGLAIAQARATGYANCFDAIPSDVPWRPPAADDAGRPLPRPTAHGAQSAIVIGPDGGDWPNGADELHCDRLGRVRIRFHWQERGDASCWIRVAQRSAGGSMGCQFLPRIGQEVLVQFLDNDIDRPIIVGALYNGQGEGGIPPTPGGVRVAAPETSPFGRAHDHAPSAQGNLAGGNSPVWHGASADSAGHRNGAAQWGIRSKEFGGAGYSQLLFDDTDAQGRVQLRCTHAATELNLGHLIHSADNYRGSFRGLGAELRTDAYGALRAGAGLLITSYKVNHSAAQRDPAGENAGGIAMLTSASKLADALSSAAVTHQTVGLAVHMGAAKANASALDDKAAPMKALLTSVSGALASASLDAARADAGAKNTAAGKDKTPHATDPIIAIAAQAGFGAVAGQSVQLANGEGVALISGQDTQFVSGGQMRVHTGQAIGVLGGAVKAGEGGLGLQLIAAKDAIDIQAQADELKVQARDEVNVISANAHIDWAAAKKISLSTAGGANITIEGGNITVQCPGKIKVHAGKKSFTGPARIDRSLPALPRSICLACLKKSLEAGPAFTMVE
ncbi:MULTISPECIES: type VI secretion system Vgr family protein [unclassified Massilia]|uniref:type VI secretion system Vgr family protein n=1 Tax=unclassified Massilia TaxID=2609279 RepID=UPI00177C8FFA|nr:MULTISPECIES: type VI secretion system Vgr family protein [unclassified Massilia]MBD8528680.1 type VI secretion system tip protein VgrG [Massilia sp. CFBP 13647]MBD8672284.1 type VI secretion system tip protein VgrG [Massilia sp. CFBP 13721]